MEFEDMELEESATQGGMKQFGRVMAVGIILIVAAFGDVMYLQLMNSHFPGGLLMALCYVGAFTSLLAVAYMLIGKSILFTPGMQTIVAWFVFVIELTLIALNIILVFQSDGSTSTGFLAVWLQLAPATPVINMAGVAILYFLDEEGKMRNEDVELAWDMKRAKRRFFKATAKARLRLQNKQLNFLVTEMDRAVASPESMQAIQQTAIEMNQYLLGQLSGGRTYRVPALPAGTTVDANPPTPTPPSTPPVAPEPNKKRGWFKNPFAREEPLPVYTNRPDLAAKVQDAARQTMREDALSPRASGSVADARRARRAARMRGAATPGNYPATETAKQERKQAVGPTTEKLAPFPTAPTPPRGNGAKMNGHHPKPMMQ